MKIAIIGAGNLGKSIAVGITSQKVFEYERLYLTKRHVETLRSFEDVP